MPSESVFNEFLDKVIENLNGNEVVSIIGIAFKPHTPVIEESAALKLVEALLEKGVKVKIYDPIAKVNARKHFGNRVNYASRIQECLDDGGACVLTMEDKKFVSAIEKHDFHKPIVLIDCWRAVNRTKLKNKIKYVPLGKFSDGR